MYVVHATDTTTRDRSLNISDFIVLQEVRGFSSKRDIDISIDLVLGATQVSKTPHKMGTPKLKELQIQLEELLKKGYIHPSVSPWGSPILFR